MDWIVNDSDEDERLELPVPIGSPEPLVISDFTPLHPETVTVGDLSSISNFTEGTSTKHLDTTIESYSAASGVFVEKPNSYRLELLTSPTVIASEKTTSGVSSAAAVAGAFNSLNDNLVQGSNQVSFSSGIAEKAKTRRRQPKGAKGEGISPSNKKAKSNLRRSKNTISTHESPRTSGIIIELSSDNDDHLDSGSKFSDLPTEPWTSSIKYGSIEPDVANRYTRLADAAVLTTLDSPSTHSPSPIFDQKKQKSIGTPHSSHPSRGRAKRKLILDEEEEFPDSLSSLLGGSSKPLSCCAENKDKEPDKKKKKSRDDKNLKESSTVATTRYSADDAYSPDAKLEKAEKGKKSGRTEGTVGISEDELLLVPASRKTPHTSPTPDYSTHAPSLPETVLPPVSDSPSVYVSVPPVASTSRNRVSKPKKAKPSKTKGKGRRRISEDEDELSHTSLPGEINNQKSSMARGELVDTRTSTEENRMVEKERETEISPLPDSGNQASTIGKLQQKTANEARRKIVVMSSDEDDSDSPRSVPKPTPVVEEGKSKDIREANKENQGADNQAIQVSKTLVSKHTPDLERTTETSPPPPSKSKLNLKSRDSISHTLPNRRESMSLLIRRASSKLQSPFVSPIPSRVHSPLAKASRTTLSRIAPLHPNRRTPPPPPPRPPPPKKSKKMLEMEERWEEELSETIEGWSCMTDEERAVLRRAKRDHELGYDD